MEGNVTIEDLYIAYFDCRKNKRGTPNALSFELNYETELNKLLYEINTRTYDIGTSICFVVTKPKLREVFAADFRDRVVHHLVIRKLESLFEDYFIEDTYNCRKEKGVLYGIGRLQRKIYEASEGYTKDVWIAKFDCKGFFMSIHKPTLWAMLERFINERYNAPDKEVIWWLARKIVLHEPQLKCEKRSPEYMWNRLEKSKSLFTCGEDCGLPIGNLSSQTFANFYLSEFDRWMTERFGGYYGRYVDDFYVIGNKAEILSEIPTVQKMLRRLHVKLHPQKIYLQHYSKGVRFTGGIVKFDRRYLNNDTIANFRDAIARFNLMDNKVAHIVEFCQSVNSYLGLLGQFREYKVRKQEMTRLSAEWFKYIYIKGSYKKVVIKNKYKRKIKDDMIRVTDFKEKYVAVRKYNENRYRINFDLMPVVVIEDEHEVETDLATWSVQDYRRKPTTEEVQEDVKTMTIQRYEDEGLEPPKAEDIDVSAYVIE